MEWEEAETLFPSPILMEGEVCPTPSRGGEVVCSAPICGGGVVSNTSFSEGGVVCPDPFSGGEEVCPAQANRRKRKRAASHSKHGIQLRNTPDHLYYALCSWCTAEPREHRQPSIQLYCAHAGTRCPDLSSNKTAAEIWWQSKDARLSHKSWPSSKKKRKTTIPLVGEPRQVSFDHQKMARLEGRIEEAALVIETLTKCPEEDRPRPILTVPAILLSGEISTAVRFKKTYTHYKLKTKIKENTN